jgi:hypothetical protein
MPTLFRSIALVLCLLFAANVLLSSCATILKGSNSAVKILGTQPGELLEVYKDSTKIPVEISQGNPTVKLPAQSSHILTIRYKGSEKQYMAKQIPGFGWGVLNFLFTGLIGFIVDGSNGNANEFADIVLDPAAK